MLRQSALGLTTCRIDLVNGALAITSPYLPMFVAALKAEIPASDRKWDGQSKRWMVTPFYGPKVQSIIEQYYGERVGLPQLQTGSQQTETRILDIRYIGACKAREGGEETAFAWVNGGWNAIIPKAVLLEWFGQTQRPDEAQTLYGVLGVSQTASNMEIKAAWKRLARTWHPDVSKEPGSAEQFRTISEAYDVLSQPLKRGKYDAGLAFEAMSKAHSQDNEFYRVGKSSYTKEYRPPLRCGLILVEGQERLGRFVVSSIKQWADLVNERGEVLVTSWGSGDEHFTESWVTA